MVLCTYRDTDVDRTHPLSSMLADFRRLPAVSRIALDGLGDDGVRDLLTRITHQAEAVIANCLDGAQQQQYYGVLRRLSRYPLVDTVAARRRIAEHLVEVERYAL